MTNPTQTLLRLRTCPASGGVHLWVFYAERTIDNWVAQKRIPYLRLSARLLRFSLPKIEAALGRYEVKEVGVRR